MRCLSVIFWGGITATPTAHRCYSVGGGTPDWGGFYNMECVERGRWGPLTTTGSPNCRRGVRSLAWPPPSQMAVRPGDGPTLRPVSQIYVHAVGLRPSLRGRAKRLAGGSSPPLNGQKKAREFVGALYLRFMRRGGEEPPSNILLHPRSEGGPPEWAADSVSAKEARLTRVSSSKMNELYVRLAQKRWMRLQASVRLSVSVA